MPLKTKRGQRRTRYGVSSFGS